MAFWSNFSIPKLAFLRLPTQLELRKLGFALLKSTAWLGGTLVVALCLEMAKETIANVRATGIWTMTWPDYPMASIVCMLLLSALIMEFSFYLVFELGRPHPGIPLGDCFVWLATALILIGVCFHNAFLLADERCFVKHTDHGLNHVLSSPFIWSSLVATISVRFRIDFFK